MEKDYKWGNVRLQGEGAQGGSEVETPPFLHIKKVRGCLVSLPYNSALLDSNP